MSKRPLDHTFPPPRLLDDDNPDAVVDLSCGSSPFAINHDAGTSADDPVVSTSDRPCHLQDALERVREKGHSNEKVHLVELDLIKIAACLSATQSRHSRPVQTTLSDIPCNPLELRPLLATIKWAKFWKSKHRWYAIRSSLNWLLRELGWVDGRGLTSIELEGTWKVAHATIAPKSRQYIFTKFAQFVIVRSGSPADVIEETFEQYRQLRLTRTIDVSAESGIRALRCIWNGLAGRVAGWSGRRLQPPTSARVYSVPHITLNPNFLTDCNTYLARLENPGPFEGVGRRRAPATIKCLRGLFPRLASILVNQGRPASTIDFDA